MHCNSLILYKMTHEPGQHSCLMRDTAELKVMPDLGFKRTTILTTLQLACTYSPSNTV